MSRIPMASGCFYPAVGSNHAVVTMANPSQAHALRGERVAVVRECDWQQLATIGDNGPEGHPLSGIDFSFAASGPWAKTLNWSSVSRLGCFAAWIGQGGDCCGDLIMHQHQSLPGSVPSCWHHANEMDRNDFGISALTRDGVLNKVLRKVVQGRVANFCNVAKANVTASSIAWYAVNHNLLSHTPRVILQTAGMRFAETSRRVGSLGQKDTDARYKARPEDVVQQVYENALQSFTVDPETPNALMGIPKLKTFESEKFLKWVRTLPCVATGREGVDAHHIIDTLGGKMGGKTHDLFVMPLTREQHQALHKDREAWEKRNGPQWYHVLKTIDKALAIGVLQ